MPRVWIFWVPQHRSLRLRGSAHSNVTRCRTSNYRFFPPNANSYGWLNTFNHGFLNQGRLPYTLDISRKRWYSWFLKTVLLILIVYRQIIIIILFPRLHWMRLVKVNPKPRSHNVTRCCAPTPGDEGKLRYSGAPLRLLGCQEQ